MEKAHASPIPSAVVCYAWKYNWMWAIRPADYDRCRVQKDRGGEHVRLGVGRLAVWLYCIPEPTKTTCSIFPGTYGREDKDWKTQASENWC